MESLTNKNVLLGVTGGIAAYKSAEIVRHLKKSGSSVRVVMTKSAEEFIKKIILESGFRLNTDDPSWSTINLGFKKRIDFRKKDLFRK